MTMQDNLSMRPSDMRHYLKRQRMTK